LGDALGEASVGGQAALLAVDPHKPLLMCKQQRLAELLGAPIFSWSWSSRRRRFGVP
jgi:hypothetical protein